MFGPDHEPPPPSWGRKPPPVDSPMSQIRYRSQTLQTALNFELPPSVVGRTVISLSLSFPATVVTAFQTPPPPNVLTSGFRVPLQCPSPDVCVVPEVKVNGFSAAYEWDVRPEPHDLDRISPKDSFDILTFDASYSRVLTSEETQIIVDLPPLALHKAALRALRGKHSSSVAGESVAHSVTGSFAEPSTVGSSRGALSPQASLDTQHTFLSGGSLSSTLALASSNKADFLPAPSSKTVISLSCKVAIHFELNAPSPASSLAYFAKSTLRCPNGSHVRYPFFVSLPRVASRRCWFPTIPVATYAHLNSDSKQKKQTGRCSWRSEFTVPFGFTAVGTGCLITRRVWLDDQGKQKETFIYETRGSLSAVPPSQIGLFAGPFDRVSGNCIPDGVHPKGIGMPVAQLEEAEADEEEEILEDEPTEEQQFEDKDDDDEGISAAKGDEDKLPGQEGRLTTEGEGEGGELFGDESDDDEGGDDSTLARRGGGASVSDAGEKNSGFGKCCKSTDGLQGRAEIRSAASLRAAEPSTPRSDQSQQTVEPAGSKATVAGSAVGKSNAAGAIAVPSTLPSASVFNDPGKVGCVGCPIVTFIGLLGFSPLLTAVAKTTVQKTITVMRTELSLEFPHPQLTLVFLPVGGNEASPLLTSLWSSRQTTSIVPDSPFGRFIALTDATLFSNPYFTFGSTIVFDSGLLFGEDENHEKTFIAQDIIIEGVLSVWFGSIWDVAIAKMPQDGWLHAAFHRYAHDLVIAATYGAEHLSCRSWMRGEYYARSVELGEDSLPLCCVRGPGSGVFPEEEKEGALISLLYGTQEGQSSSELECSAWFAQLSPCRRLKSSLIFSSLTQLLSAPTPCAVPRPGVATRWSVSPAVFKSHIHWTLQRLLRRGPGHFVSTSKFFQKLNARLKAVFISTGMWKVSLGLMPHQAVPERTQVPTADNLAPQAFRSYPHANIAQLLDDVEAFITSWVLGTGCPTTTASLHFQLQKKASGATAVLETCSLHYDESSLQPPLELDPFSGLSEYWQAFLSSQRALECLSEELSSLDTEAAPVGGWAQGPKGSDGAGTKTAANEVDFATLLANNDVISILREYSVEFPFAEPNAFEFIAKDGRFSLGFGFVGRDPTPITTGDGALYHTIVSLLNSDWASLADAEQKLLLTADLPARHPIYFANLTARHFPLATPGVVPSWLQCFVCSGILRDVVKFPAVLTRTLQGTMSTGAFPYLNHLSATLQCEEGADGGSHVTGPGRQAAIPVSAGFGKQWATSLFLQICEERGVMEDCKSFSDIDSLPTVVALRISGLCETTAGVTRQRGGGDGGSGGRGENAGRASAGSGMQRWSSKSFLGHHMGQQGAHKKYCGSLSTADELLFGTSQAIFPQTAGAGGRNRKERCRRLPVLWLRFFSNSRPIWLSRLFRCQSIAMWEQQLENDNVVCCQLEAALALGTITSSVTIIGKLSRALREHKWHPLVRCFAADSIQSLHNNPNCLHSQDCAGSICRYLRTYHYKPMPTNMYDEDDTAEGCGDDLSAVKTPPYYHTAEMFLLKDMLYALSKLHGIDGRTPGDVGDTLLEFFMRNDDGGVNASQFSAFVVSCFLNMKCNASFARCPIEAVITERYANAIFDQRDQVELRHYYRETFSNWRNSVNFDVERIFLNLWRLFRLDLCLRAEDNAVSRASLAVFANRRVFRDLCRAKYLEDLNTVFDPLTFIPVNYMSFFIALLQPVAENTVELVDASEPAEGERCAKTSDNKATSSRAKQLLGFCDKQGISDPRLRVFASAESVASAQQQAASLLVSGYSEFGKALSTDHQALSRPNSEVGGQVASNPRAASSTGKTEFSGAHAALRFALEGAAELADQVAINCIGCSDTALFRQGIHSMLYCAAIGALEPPLLLLMPCSTSGLVTEMSVNAAVSIEDGLGMILAALKYTRPFSCDFWPAYEALRQRLVFLSTEKSPNLSRTKLLRHDPSTSHSDVALKFVARCLFSCRWTTPQEERVLQRTGRAIWNAVAVACRLEGLLPTADATPLLLSIWESMVDVLGKVAMDAPLSLLPYCLKQCRLEKEEGSGALNEDSLDESLTDSMFWDSRMDSRTTPSQPAGPAGSGMVVVPDFPMEESTPPLPFIEPSVHPPYLDLSPDTTGQQQLSASMKAPGVGEAGVIRESSKGESKKHKSSKKEKKGDKEKHDKEKHHKKSSKKSRRSSKGKHSEVSITSPSPGPLSPSSSPTSLFAAEFGTATPEQAPQAMLQSLVQRLQPDDVTASSSILPESSLGGGAAQAAAAVPSVEELQGGKIPAAPTSEKERGTEGSDPTVQLTVLSIDEEILVTQEGVPDAERTDEWEALNDETLLLDSNVTGLENWDEINEDAVSDLPIFGNPVAIQDASNDNGMTLGVEGLDVFNEDFPEPAGATTQETPEETDQSANVVAAAAEALLVSLPSEGEATGFLRSAVSHDEIEDAAWESGWQEEGLAGPLVLGDINIGLMEPPTLPTDPASASNFLTLAEAPVDEATDLSRAVAVVLTERGSSEEITAIGFTDSQGREPIVNEEEIFIVGDEAVDNADFGGDWESDFMMAAGAADIESAPDISSRPVGADLLHGDLFEEVNSETLNDQGPASQAQPAVELHGGHGSDTDDFELDAEESPKDVLAAPHIDEPSFGRPPPQHDDLDEIFDQDDQFDGGGGGTSGGRAFDFDEANAPMGGELGNEDPFSENLFFGDDDFMMQDGLQPGGLDVAGMTVDDLFDEGTGVSGDAAAVGESDFHSGEIIEDEEVDNAMPIAPQIDLKSGTMLNRQHQVSVGIGQGSKYGLEDVLEEAGDGDVGVFGDPFDEMPRPATPQVRRKRPPLQPAGEGGLPAPPMPLQSQSTNFTFPLESGTPVFECAQLLWRYLGSQATVCPSIAERRVYLVRQVYVFLFGVGLPQCVATHVPPERLQTPDPALVDAFVWNARQGRYLSKMSRFKKRYEGENAAGLVNEWQTVAREITELLMDLPYSGPFLYAVSLEEAPEYNKIIENPMWLTKVHENLVRQKYRAKEEWKNDLFLIFRNCRTFNKTESKIFQDCEKLQNVLYELLRPFEKLFRGVSGS